MKKLLVGLLLFCAVFAFAGGGAEPEAERGTIQVTICGGYNGKAGGPHEIIFTKFKEKYPDIYLMVAPSDVSTGAPVTIDAFLAAGIPPAAYNDFISRSGRVMRKEFALDLGPYETAAFWDDFKDGILDPVTKDGAIYAIPHSAQVDGMFINTTLLDEVGYVKPDNWTIDDYLEMCRLVRDKAPGKYGSMLFAANQSSTEWLLGWFAAFGTEFFQNGDYSKTTIVETGGEKVFAFWKQLYDEGFVPPESHVLTDDDSRAMMLKGDIATCGDYIRDWSGGIESQVTQGIIDALFEYTMDAFPRLPGAPPTPVIMVYTAIVANNTDDPYVNEAMAYLATLFADIEWQAYMVTKNFSMATRKSVSVEPPNEMWTIGTTLIEVNGLFDVGIASGKYTGIRPLLHKELQAVLTGSKTPAEAVRDYADGINKALK